MLTNVQYKHTHTHTHKHTHMWGFPSGSAVENPPAMQDSLETRVQFLGLGRSSGGGHGNPLQYSCLENPVDRGAWRDTVYKSDTTKATVHMTLTGTCMYERES